MHVFTEMSSREERVSFKNSEEAVCAFVFFLTETLRRIILVLLLMKAYLYLLCQQVVRDRLERLTFPYATCCMTSMHMYAYVHIYVFMYICISLWIRWQNTRILYRPRTYHTRPYFSTTSLSVSQSLSISLYIHIYIHIYIYICRCMISQYTVSRHGPSRSPLSGL